MFTLDPNHASFNLFDDQIIQDIWREKYALPDEKTVQDTFKRVSKAIYVNDLADHMNAGYTAMCAGLWMPGGRILASAGAETNSTLMNCYVCKDLGDSMESIMSALSDAAITLSKYGGIGMNFGSIRPKGAKINRVGLEAPGAVAFMDLWHNMSNTIMQAGHRRGAMMGVLPDWHPDLLDFIEAKHTAGRLTNFNVSILVSDAFMKAVKKDQTWALKFPIPPTRSIMGVQQDYMYKDDEGKLWYEYKRIKAKELWEKITRATYEFSEPGVIFIDRINQMNNLQYCETIECTNPCGEQPLPPNGTCNLGAVNLARMVIRPYQSDAMFDYQLLRDVVSIGTRFLDNVIDVTNYPLEEQRKEEVDKRRLGLGVSGLADMLIQLGLKYNSPNGRQAVTSVMQILVNEAYYTSIWLAKEKGTFPLFEPAIIRTGFIKETISLSFQEHISKYGLRNGVLLTIAPTGTTSILFGNISSGIEPVFLHRTKRKMWISNNETKEYISEGFSARFFKYCTGNNIESYDFAVTADEVSVEDHVKMQAVCQHWIDASISKTINVPKEMKYEDFVRVYDLAYELGCKGCTTYRPSDVRGSVLSAPDEIPEVKLDEAKIQTEPTAIFPPYDKPQEHTLQTKIDMKIVNEIAKDFETDMEEYKLQTKRPQVLVGCTYKINWPGLESAVFVTINENHGQPWEIFISSKDLQKVEWTTALSVMISGLFRHGIDPLVIAEQLSHIRGAHDGQWVDKKFYGSLVAYIGHILSEHFQRTIGHGDPHSSEGPKTGAAPPGEVEQEGQLKQGKRCPKCGGNTLHYKEGCYACFNCGYNKCE